MKMAIFADGRLRVDDDSYPWDVRARRGYSGSCEQASGAPDMVEVSLLLTFSMGEEQRKDFYAAFRKAGAQEVIGEPPSTLVNLLDVRWKQVGTSSYYRYSLEPL